MTAAGGRTSAGLLLHRPGPGGGQPEVLLGHLGGPYWVRRERAWGIPKGEIDPGEEPHTAAAREFTEELGLAVPDGPWHDLGEVRQSGGKRVLVWALAADLDPEAITPGTFELEWPPRSGRVQSFPEVDRVAWLALDRADALVIAGQRPFLRRLQDLLAG